MMVKVEDTTLTERGSVSLTCAGNNKTKRKGRLAIEPRLDFE